MVDVKVNTPRATRTDSVERAHETERTAAHAAGYRAGEKAAEALANVKADLFRRELAIVLLGLGDALAKNDMTIMAWYSLASRLYAGGAGG